MRSEPSSGAGSGETLTVVEELVFALAPAWGERSEPQERCPDVHALKVRQIPTMPWFLTRLQRSMLLKSLPGARFRSPQAIFFSRVPRLCLMLPLKLTHRRKLSGLEAAPTLRPRIGRRDPCPARQSLPDETVTLAVRARTLNAQTASRRRPRKLLPR
jgi:hypothetical protein